MKKLHSKASLLCVPATAQHTDILLASLATKLLQSIPSLFGRPKTTMSCRLAVGYRQAEGFFVEECRGYKTQTSCAITKEAVRSGNCEADRVRERLRGGGPRRAAKSGFPRAFVTYCNQTADKAEKDGLVGQRHIWTCVSFLCMVPVYILFGGLTQQNCIKRCPALPLSPPHDGHERCPQTQDQHVPFVI